MSTYFLDTNILIYFLQGSEKIKSLFENKLDDSQGTYFSFITRLELLSLQSLTKSDVMKIDTMLNEFYRIDYNL